MEVAISLLYQQHNFIFRETVSQTRQLEYEGDFEVKITVEMFSDVSFLNFALVCGIQNFVY